MKSPPTTTHELTTKRLPWTGNKSVSLLRTSTYIDTKYELEVVDLDGVPPTARRSRVHVSKFVVFFSQQSALLWSNSRTASSPCFKTSHESQSLWYPKPNRYPRFTLLGPRQNQIQNGHMPHIVERRVNDSKLNCLPHKFSESRDYRRVDRFQARLCSSLVTDHTTP